MVDIAKLRKDFETALLSAKAESVELKTLQPLQDLLILQRGKKIRLHDEGLPVRNWLHADDTAEAVMSIIDSGTVNEIYNVAGGFEQKNIDTVLKVIDNFHESEYKWEEHVDFSYSREGQDVRYALNDDKLRALGWTPKKKFDEEIYDIVQYYKQNFIW